MADGRNVSPAIQERLRLLTILVVDVVGSTAAVESLSVEDARDYLANRVGLITGIIRDYGGTVVNIQGDGVLAVFGDVQSREDDTIRCCKAALQIMEQAKTFSDAADWGSAFKARAGIHAGEVMLHRTFSDHGSWLDITGYPVNVAAKIQQAAEPGTVCISSEATLLLNGLLGTGDPETVRFDGSQKPIEYRPVLPPGPEVLDLASSVMPPKELFVGRDAELGELQLRVGQSSGNVSSYLFEGEAGVGKSRLCIELLALAERAAVRTIVIKGEHSTRNTSFLALVPAVSDLLNLTLPISTGQLELALRSAGIPESHLNAFQDLFGLTDLDPVYAGEKSSLRFAAILSAASSVFEFASRMSPKGMLLIIEDTDQLDEFTLRALVKLQADLEGHNVTFVATSRPDTRNRLDLLDGIKRQLLPLEPESARKIVESYSSDGEGIDTNVVDEIVNASNGIPFILRAYAQTYNKNRFDAGGKLPLDLKASTQLRLERLSKGARSLMNLLVSSPGGLERELCDRLIPADTCVDDLAAELTRAGFAKTGSVKYLELQHALLEQACNSIMLRSEKKELHRQLLEALQAVASKPLPLDRLASHARRAEQYESALKYYWAACKREVRRSSLPAITEIFHKAKDICTKLGSSADEQFARFSLLTFDSFQQRGMMEGLTDRMHQVADYGRKINNPLYSSQALTHSAMVDWFHANHQTSYKNASEARSIARSANIPPLAIYAQYIMASAKQGKGEIQSAIALHTELIAHIERSPKLLESVAIQNTVFVSHSLAVWCMAQSGETSRAESVLSRARSLSEGADYPFGHVMLYAAAGLLARAKGDYQDALHSFQECQKYCQNDHVDAMEAFAVSHICQCLVRLGDYERALSVVNDGFERGIDKLCGSCCIVYMHLAKAEADMFCGDLQSCDAQRKQALEVAEKTGEPNSILLALLVNAGVLARTAGDIGLANELYQRGYGIAESSGFKPAMKHCENGIKQTAKPSDTGAPFDPPLHDCV